MKYLLIFFLSAGCVKDYDFNPYTTVIKELIKIGNDKGCYRITLFCDKPLLNFYEKNGFKINRNEIVLKTYLKK